MPTVSEWREAKPPKGEPGPIFNFRKGYNVNKAGIHESSDQYVCFQKYLLLQGSREWKELASITNHHDVTLSRWAEMFNWEKRAAEWDRRQMAIVWKEAQKFQRNNHKEAIVEFRESSERQAKMMANVSEDLLRVLGKRIAKAEEEGEEVPMALVSGLLRAAANISEQSRQSWANALGINEMLEMVEAEIDKVSVEEVTDVDAYEIPLDE
jgi:hypothetical protein